MNAPSRSHRRDRATGRINPYNAGGGYLSAAPARRLSSGRGLLPRGLAPQARGAALLVVVLVLTAACASVAPGEDPVVVRAEQALRAGDAIYRESMAYWYSPGVAPTFSPEVSQVFETVRVGFDPVYKDTQKTLDTYKDVRRAIAAGKAGDQVAAAKAVTDAVTKLAALVNRLLGNVPRASQTLSKGKPVEVH